VGEISALASVRLRSKATDAAEPRPQLPCCCRVGFALPFHGKAELYSKQRLSQPTHQRRANRTAPPLPYSLLEV
jgi:hypothetical protein